MLMTRTRSLSAMAAGALVLTVLAGCGSEDKTDDAGAAGTSSASPSATATTSGSSDSGSTEVAAPGERLTKDNLVATMLAAMQEKKTAHMSMEIGSSISADADVRYSSEGTDMKMSMNMGSTRAVVILVDGKGYIQQSAGGKFVEVAKDTPGLGDIVKQFSGLSPISSVEAMESGLKKVEYAGTDEVDGDKVSKYHVTIDTTAMAEKLGSTADVPKTVTYDLYVDDNHLMRRIDMNLESQAVKVLVDKWGEPVQITPPPASEILSQ